jgi:hypothetical protein
MSRCLAVGAVQDEGRRIAGPDSAEITPVPPEVPPGQVLVAVVDNGTWQQARDVSHRTAYDALYRRVADGVWRRMSLYLIDAARALEIEDGRRMLMDGRPVPDPGRS